MADVFELELLAEMPNYYGWIMETLAPFVRGNVIEYGAGTGTISQRLTTLADKLVLVEPSADLAAVLRAMFRDDPKVMVINESLEQHALRIGAATVDTVVMVNVLEHVEDDRQALAQLFRILQPGGHLLIFVPALQKLMSKLDLMFGHFRRYHRTDLVQKVAQAGGEAELCRYFDFLGILPWFFLNKLMGATTFNPQLAHIHDKFVVPISRTAERAISPPIGKNIILVARKQ
jgi:SAM-dependent methyltransferase